MIRHYLPRVVLAFAAWTAGVTVTHYHERAIAVEELADARVRAECAYHEGIDEGYRSGISVASEIHPRIPETTRRAESR